jgi:hypothetical protein
MSGRVKAQATTEAAADKARAAAAARQSATPAIEDAASELAAAEGAIEAEAEARPAAPAKAARPAVPAKAAPAPPPEPTLRLKALERTKEKDDYKMLQDEVKKLSDQLQKVHREKEQLKEAHKAKGGRRASQEQKPTKTNAQRRTEMVCVETTHKDRNIQSFDAVRKPGCISPAGYPPITTQLV